MPFLSINGLDYHIKQTGSGPALLLLHGFTGSLTNWAPHIPCFSRHFTTVSVDLPGHGLTGTPDAPARHRHEQVSSDLVAILEQLGLHRFHLLGYSMGGRLALSLALANPERLHSLVLESASPGLPTAAERSARRQQDEAVARRIEQDGVSTFVAHWEQLPLFANQQQLPADQQTALRQQRLRNSARGLADSLRGAGTGAHPSNWPQLASLGVPALLLTGALDVKFCAVADKMVAANLWFRAHRIENAGHCIHLEQPKLFQNAVLNFLNETGESPC